MLRKAIYKIMFQYSQNTCYLKVVRPPTKTTKHFFSGKCEIQRVSLSSDHESLEYSIRHSKVLESYKQKYPFCKPYSLQQVQHIIKTKQIADEQNKFYIAKLLRELHCFHYTFHYLESKRKVKYNKQNTDHENKLMQLWKNLKPKENLKSRISEQWISVGFQVSDPATDFRGAGQLGLYNLFQFSLTKKCGQILKIALQPETEYFFCSAGLFFTMLSMEIVKSRVMDYHYWIHQSEAQLLNNFQILYETIFIEFSKFWINECGNKSVMYFNQNLKNFELSIKKLNSFEMKKKIMQNKN